MKTVQLFFGIIMLQFLILSCNLNDSKYKDFIGKEYRSLTEFEDFKGFEEMGGTMMQSLNNIEYGLSHYKKDSVDLIVFEKILKQTDGKTKYSLIDIVEIIGLGKNQYISYGLCRLNEKPDSELIAVYLVDDNVVEYYTNIKEAWRANRKTGHIEKIETNGIDCINEGYGVE